MNEKALSAISRAILIPSIPSGGTMTLCRLSGPSPFPAGFTSHCADGGEMRVYLAAKYSRHPEMRSVRDQIVKSYRKYGEELIVTSRWIEGGHDITDDCDRDAQRQRFASEDYEDLVSSDVVLWFSEPEKIEGHNRGGRHVEFGIALALEIPIFVIGRKENVFHYLPCVGHFEDLISALTAISEVDDNVLSPDYDARAAIEQPEGK